MHIPIPALSLPLLILAMNYAATEPDTLISFEAEQHHQTLTRFKDPLASGKGCVAASLSQASGKLFIAQSPQTFEPGLYRVRFHLRLSSLESAINTGLSITIACQNKAQILWQGLFHPPDQYSPFDLFLDHSNAGPLEFSVTWTQVAAKDFFEKAFDKEVAREVKVDETRVDLTEIPGAGSQEAGLAVDEEDEALVELQGGGKLSELVPPYLALDRIEVSAIQHIAHTFRIVTNKIRYEPEEKGEATVEIRNYRPEAQTLQARIRLVKELDESQPVWEGQVSLPPGGVETLKIPFQVGPEHFGHALVVELLKEGRAVDVADEPFGVAIKNYEISIWGNGPGQDNWTMTDKQFEAIVTANHRSYANIYEFFSWAPCDFWEQSPDVEDWYSGQTQYHCGKRSLQRFHEICHQRGIQSASYYQAAAKPPAGLKALLTRPEWFSQGAIGIGFWGVDVDALERMARGDWGDGKDRLRSYQPMGINCNLEAVAQHGGDELVRSAEMFGWDAVRYDGHFMGWGEDADAITARNDQIVRAIVSSKLPKYQFGYNAGTVQLSTSERYVRDDLLNFAQMCEGGGLIMNEAFRDYPNRNFSAAVIKDYIPWVNREARATRRSGGYHLGFFFDRASPSDHTYNAAIELASGSRPLAYGWSGPAQAWPQFITRFSAYYWDNELFEMLGESDRIAVAGPVSVWFEPFCYRRPRGPGHGQVVVHLVVPPRYTSFNDLLQSPAPILRDVKISLRPDTDWKAESAWFLTPCEPGLTGRIPLEVRGEVVEATLPKLTIFASVVFNLQGPPGSEFPVTRLPEFQETGPLKKLWLRVEALRNQGYFSAVDQPRRDKELQSIQRIAAGVAATEGTPQPNTVDPLGFRKIQVRAEIPPPKDFERPKDIQLRRNSLLDIRVGRGVLNWMLRLDEAFGRLGGAVVRSSFLKVATPWADSVGKLTDMPWNYETILETDVVVLNNIGACHIDAPSLHRLRDFVAQGGGLLILGGHWTLGKGGFRDSPLEDVLPVFLFAGNPQEEIAPVQDPGPPPGAALVSPTPDTPQGISALPWNSKPAVRYAHRIEPRPDSQVWLRGGQVPLLVAGRFGRGRVAVWAGTVHGQFADHEIAFWQWHAWPQLLAETLAWLGEGYQTTYQPKPEWVSEDDAIASVASLSENEPEEARRILAELCAKADPEASAYLLTAHGDELDLSEEQMVQLVDRIPPGTAGLVAPARRFLESGQPPTLAAGVRLLGLSGDKSLETEVLEYLQSSFTDVQTGAALALADIGSPRSLPALVKKTQKLEKEGLGSEEVRRLYHRTLVARHRLGDVEVAGRLAAASLYSYGAAEDSWREWAGLMEEAGTAFKKTAREYSQWQMKMRRALAAQARWLKEYEFLAHELRHLPAGASSSLAQSLRQATQLPSLGLLHRVLSGAEAETVRGLLPLLEARMPTLAAAVAAKARTFPQLQATLVAEMIRLARSNQATHRLFVAQQADLLPEDVIKEVLSSLVKDPDKAVCDAAIQAQRALLR